MIDTHTQKNGYTEISPPLIATAETMYELANYQNLKMINLKLN